MGNLCVRDLDHLFSTIEHSSYHFTHNLDVWTGVMGSQTLADLVAGIFSGVTSALASVKAGLEAAWDGIKNAGEYILKSVINAIFTSFATMFNSLLFSESKILEEIIPGFSLLTYNGTGQLTLQFMGAQRTLGMDVKDTDLSIFFPGAGIHIDPFLGAHVETLGFEQVMSIISNIALSGFTVLADFVLAFIFRNMADTGSLLDAVAYSIIYNILTSITVNVLYKLSKLHKPLPEMSIVELNNLREVSLSTAMFYMGISIIFVALLFESIFHTIRGFKGTAIILIVTAVGAFLRGYSLSEMYELFTGHLLFLLDPSFDKLHELANKGGDFILPTISLLSGLLAGIAIANIFSGEPLELENIEKPTRWVSLASIPVILPSLARYLFLSNGFSLVVDAVDLEIARR